MYWKQGLQDNHKECNSSKSIFVIVCIAVKGRENQKKNADLIVSNSFLRHFALKQKSISDKKSHKAVKGRGNRKNFTDYFSLKIW